MLFTPNPTLSISTGIVTYACPQSMDIVQISILVSILLNLTIGYIILIETITLML